MSEWLLTEIRNGVWEVTLLKSDKETSDKGPFTGCEWEWEQEDE